MDNQSIEQKEDPNYNRLLFADSFLENSYKFLEFISQQYNDSGHIGEIFEIEKTENPEEPFKISRFTGKSTLSRKQTPPNRMFAFIVGDHDPGLNRGVNNQDFDNYQFLLNNFRKEHSSPL